jgi:monoamine oxidase
MRIHTARGVIEADRVIVALPSQVLAEQPEIFSPLLPEKTDAAAGLPLGIADKLYLSLERAEEFETDSRVFGHTDRAATAVYHLRPFGRPLIECYFGGSNADGLEKGGAAAFAEFAADELCTVFGSDFRRRIKPLPMQLWHADPFARGSYSYAKPGRAGCRAVLAAPVDDRLFFAGEACSPHFFSTAHGAYESGVTAAEQILRLR